MIAARRLGLRRGFRIAGGLLVTALLAWRVLLLGWDALQRVPAGAAKDELVAPLGIAGAERYWQQRLIANPADATALLGLGLELEKQGKAATAGDAISHVVALAPGDPSTLLQAADFFLRSGQDAVALHILRRYIEASAGVYDPRVGSVFARALDTRRHTALFDTMARENPLWWPVLFHQLCNAAAVEAVEALFVVRERATLATEEERRCLVARLQREDDWTNAYLLWLNGLGPTARQRVPYLFNGDFQRPFSGAGFDWIVMRQDGVAPTIEAGEPTAGSRVLQVSYENRRYAGSPIAQYLVLAPGHYRFAGRVRTDIETWLGLQWGLYCVPRHDREERQIARSERFVGSIDWHEFEQEFSVPEDCPAQQLRLELANPRADATVAGTVVAKLNGELWFDQLRIQSADAAKFE